MSGVATGLMLAMQGEVEQDRIKKENIDLKAQLAEKDKIIDQGIMLSARAIEEVDRLKAQLAAANAKIAEKDKAIAELQGHVDVLTSCRNHWKRSYVELKKALRDLVGTGIVGQPKGEE
jgi:uncharacterized protein HemX